MSQATDEAVAQVPADERVPWLLLIHKLPPKPDYLRVKVQRRLRKLGARLIKNSVYALPNTEDSLEDFAWLCREIEADGGEAMVCESNFVLGRTNAEVRAMRAGGEPEPEALVRRGADQVVSGSTWVTRRGIGVDRMASAWLIRRFIDRAATFRFESPSGYRPAKGELRFDMFDGEYTHDGDACTFEVLLRRFTLTDRALVSLAELVHDVDCKDAKFARPEAAGLEFVVDSIRKAHTDDAARLERGVALFDDLYDRLAKETAAA